MIRILKIMLSLNGWNELFFSQFIKFKSDTAISKNIIVANISYK